MRIARLLPLLASSLAMGACVSVDLAGKSARTPVAYFDLGEQPSGEAGPMVVGLRGVEVAAPSWLDTPAMQYRLAYAEAARRSSFSESRWVAPPPELIRQSLRRTLAPAEGGAGGCRLHVDVDEFIQRFDAPQSSTAIVELRAALLAPRGEAPLARKAFRVSQAAPSADARGGVAALAAATREAADAMRAWLERVAAEPADATNIAQRCRPG